MITQETHI